MNLNAQQQRCLLYAITPVVVVWLVNGFYLAALAKIGIALFWAVDMIQWIGLPLVLLIFLAKRASIRPKHYGLGVGALRWQKPVVGTVAVFVTTGLTFLWTRHWTWLLLGYPSGYFSFPELYPGGIAGTAVWVYSAVTAGIVESIFFIGLPWLLYHNALNKPSRIAFAILSGLVFALAHWEQGPHAVIYAFLFALIACFWFFRLGTLWPVAAGHALVDLVAFA